MGKVQLLEALLLALTSSNAYAQAPAAQFTRFTVTGAPMLSQAKEEFGSNIGSSFGGGGGIAYHLDRSGLLSMRFDLSGFVYGSEGKRAPFSETVGGRVLVDVTTTNSTLALGFGPELAVPKGPLRPYLNAGFGGLLFRTVSSVQGISSGEEHVVSTTNHSDLVRAWIIGSGVTIPLPGKASNFSLDLGVRYHRGGRASYLREGSIRDNPNGSISFTPLSTPTPYLGYIIGVRYRVPYVSPNPCPRFLC